MESKADSLQWEMDLCHALLVQLRHAAKSARIDFIEGNHEQRIIKYLNGRARELRSLRDLSIDRLLKLQELDIHYTKDPIFLNNEFVVTHGTRTTKQSAKGELEHNGVSGISGHCHRTNQARIGDIVGRVKRWYSLGHLSIAKDMDYAVPFYHTWDQSFAVVEYDEDSFDVTIIECDGKKFKYEGKEYDIKRTKEA